MRERAVLLGETSPVVTIISEPRPGGEDGLPAVIVLNSGVVHRVGPGRFSVRLARQFCRDGFLTARFDHCGIGDSGVRRDRLAMLEAFIAETHGVMDGLQRHYGVERFVLAGLCSGALTSFKTAVDDPRVVGCVLMNTQGLNFSAEWSIHVKTRGWMRNYWRHSIRNADSWRRALTGRVQYRRFLRVVSNFLRDRLLPSKSITATSTELSAELRRLIDRGVALLFVLSRGDHAEDDLRILTQSQIEYLRGSGRFRAQIVPRSDHTFTLLANQAEVLRAAEEWTQAARSLWRETLAATELQDVPTGGGS